MSHSPSKKSSSSKKPIVNARATSSSSSADHSFRATSSSSSADHSFRPVDIEFVEAVKEKYKIQVPESYHKKRKDTVKQTEVEVVEIDDENDKTSVDAVTGIFSKYYNKIIMLDYANYFQICEFG
jgi:hypothetical protein